MIVLEPQPHLQLLLLHWSITRIAAADDALLFICSAFSRARWLGQAQIFVSCCFVLLLSP